MKSYKLIKLYPNCKFELGHILSFDASNDWCAGINIKELDSFSEFWQLVGQEDKYLSGYNAPHNTGTHHWMYTVLGAAKSRAEYMIKHGLDERTKNYPQDIFNALTDLFTAHKEGLIKTRD